MLCYIAYFVPLLWALWGCFADAMASSSLGRMAVATASIATTWFYILRYTFNYNGEYLFRDAYVDVSAPFYWGVTSQLLSWAVVAMAWSHQTRSPKYQVLGVFGAMSASFTLWNPSERRRPSCEGMPVQYLVAALSGLVCIYRLKDAAENIEGGAASFEFWLAALHLLLLAPKIIGMSDWMQSRRVPLSLAYALLLVGVAMVHREAVADANHSSSSSLAVRFGYAAPATDCQISIGLDLVFATLLTVFTIVDYYEPTKSLEAALIVLGLLAVMPYVTPAGVLVAHLAARHCTKDHGAVVGKLQRSIARTLSRAETEEARDGRGWVNLGYWRDTSEFAVACRQLAEVLARAVGMSEGDRILSVGCGSGEELDLYKRKFGCARVLGVEVNAAAVNAFVPSPNVRMVRIPMREKYHETLRTGLQCCGVMFSTTGPGKGDFDKVVALDNVYHHPSRRAFFMQTAEMLPPGGKVGVTDMVLKRQSLPLWVRVLLWLMNVRVPPTKGDYAAMLRECGFGGEAISFDLLEPYVLTSWPNVSRSTVFVFVARRLLQYIDYCAIVGSRPVSSYECSPRPKVAIIGSGMAGCATAHRLAPDFDVTVFESRDQVSLGGYGVNLGTKLVDIPLRMMGECYYPQLASILRELDIPIVSVNSDACFYDDNQVELIQPKSQLSAMAAMFKHAHHVLRFAWAVFCYDAKYDPTRGTETFGEWTRRCCSASLLNSDMMRVYLMRQLSWMYSCPYNDIDEYPADVVLHYIRSINPLAMWRRRAFRVKSSIRRLQCALTHNAKVELKKSISGIGPDRTIGGVSYDYVVLATEASAVGTLLAGNPEWTGLVDDVFPKIRYHPSRIVVHTDASLMPHGEAGKADWKSLNVHRGTDDMSSLTVWLNSYYDSNLVTNHGVAQEDIFQTWNPQVEPTKEKVLCTVQFLRVKHRSDTRTIQERIRSMQGQHGIYFCGSYSVFGVGLLEQAAVSAEYVASLIRQEQTERDNQHHESVKRDC